MFVVLFNGHSACFKKTLARGLAKQLNVPVVLTNMFGDAVLTNNMPDDVKRDVRYNNMALVVEDFLKHGESVVVVGCFGKRKWRETIYSLAKKYRVEKIVAIKCISSDLEKVRLRLLERKVLLGSEERNCHVVENYLEIVKQDEPIFDDKEIKQGLVSVVVFDSSTLKIINELGNGDVTGYVKTNLLAVIKKVENNLKVVA